MKSVLAKENPATKLANRFFHGPKDFIANTLGPDPLQTVQIDELSPWWVTDKAQQYKVWVLLLVEVVTRKIYLVPLEAQNTVSFIMALEILQSRCGHLSKIVLDAHTSHAVFETEQLDPDMTVTGVSATLLKSLNDSDRNVLETHSISIIIADGTRHSKIGLAENIVFNLKQAINNLFPNIPTVSSLFDLQHRLSLLELFLNERPTFS